MNCDNCKHTRTCTRVWRNSKKDCPHYIQKTNADHIRSMTDEELAEILCVSCAFCACHPLDNCPSSCQAGALDWLKQPYKEDA